MSLLSISNIHERLQRLFPEGLVMRNYLVREMAAKSVFVFLYGRMIEGSEHLLRPSHIYLFTEEQSLLTSDQDREAWVRSSRIAGFRPRGVRWYADTTREPIRDETIRYGLLDVGAVGRDERIPVTSSIPAYFLKPDFAEIFSPDITQDEVQSRIEAWQEMHLTPEARARMILLAAGRAKSEHGVQVDCPFVGTIKLSAGPSSVISKGVIEVFASTFLKQPALLWLSESGAKVRHQDDQLAQRIGLRFDQKKLLPDIILASLGESAKEMHLIFVEVVASDGAMTSTRRTELEKYIGESGFPIGRCLFGTAFADRGGPEVKKCLPDVAWGTFVWFFSEPERLMWLFDRPINITAPHFKASPEEG